MDVISCQGQVSRPDYEPIHNPIPWVSPQFIDGVRNEWRYVSAAPYAFMVCVGPPFPLPYFVPSPDSVDLVKLVSLPLHLLKEILC